MASFQKDYSVYIGLAIGPITQLTHHWSVSRSLCVLNLMIWQNIGAHGLLQLYVVAWIAIYGYSRSIVYAQHC